MNSYLAEPFFRYWRHLPEEVKQLARKNYRLWRANPRHPSLNFKELKPGVWSARIGLQYRIVRKLHDGDIHWIWIGAHGEYDALIRRL